MRLRLNRPSLLVVALAAVLASAAGTVAACGSSGSSVPGPDAGGPDTSASTDGALDGGTIHADASSDASLDASSLPDSHTDGEVDAGPDAAASVANARADDAVEAMMLAFWSQGPQYLLATVGSTGVTGYWTFAQAWDVVLDAVERHGGARFGGTLRTFYDAQNTIGWSRNYYDDENWMTLALIRAYDLTGDATYLTQAKALYADIMSAWDTTCCGSMPGGIWWDTAHTQKATASNAGPVISGARLATRTGDTSYLTFAEQVYAYWSTNMVSPTTYQVTDDITSAGVKRAWKFTYNEGLMIGAAVALARATGDTSTLTLANEIAGFVLASETGASPVGSVYTDGSDTQCTGDCAQFKGIGARYLATLYEAQPSAAASAGYVGLLDRSADAAWTIARDSSSRLYGTDWAAPFVAPAQLDATSSAAMTLAAVALLEGPPPADAPDSYEAEESVLHGVGLQAQYGGFSGWGYVAGWNGDGQWVDFLVNVPTAGMYDLTFRYAAGAGNASRLVYVNGANAVANQAFAGTGAWTTYASQIVTVTLPAGASTVSLIYNSSLGSTNYLNLDVMGLKAH